MDTPTKIARESRAKNDQCMFYPFFASMSGDGNVKQEILRRRCLHAPLDSRWWNAWCPRATAKRSTDRASGCWGVGVIVLTLYQWLVVWNHGILLKPQ